MRRRTRFVERSTEFVTDMPILPGTGVLGPWADECRVMARTPRDPAHRGEREPSWRGLNVASAASPRSVENVDPAAPARNRRFVPEVRHPDAPQDRQPELWTRRNGKAPNLLRAPPTARFPPAGLPVLVPGRSSLPGAGARRFRTLHRAPHCSGRGGRTVQRGWLRAVTGPAPESGYRRGPVFDAAGPGGGIVAVRYPRGMHVASIGMFASGAMRPIGWSGERGTRGPAPVSSLERLGPTAAPCTGAGRALGRAVEETRTGRRRRLTERGRTLRGASCRPASGGASGCRKCTIYQ